MGWPFQLLFSFLLFQPSFCSNCTSDDSSYDYALGVMSGMTFYWKINSGNLNGKIVYTGGEAWVAVGPSDNGDMVGSEVVMGLPDDNTVYKYDVTAKTSAGVEKMSDSKQTLTSTSISATGGTTTMEFIKIMSETGELEISSTSTTILVFAVGSSTSLGYHDDRSASSINLSNCDSSSIKLESLNKIGVFMHALLMIGAWLYLIPSGILIATFKLIFGPAWIHLHMPLQAMGTLAMIFGVLVMSTSLNTVDADHFNSESTDFGVHTYLGGMAICIAAFQVTIGILRPHKPPANEPKSMIRKCFEVLHRTIGFGSIVIAVLSVLSGIEHAHNYEYISSKTPYHIAAIIPLGIYCILLLSKVTGIFNEKKQQ